MVVSTHAKSRPVSSPVRNGRAVLSRPEESRALRWSSADYNRLGELGFFNECRVELIEGAIIEKHTAHPFRWTPQQYERLVKKGFFGDRRVEFIEGEIIEMAAMYDPHWLATYKTGAALRQAFPHDVVFGQAPLMLPDGSQPEPDVFVARGDINDFVEARRQAAERALLVVEVSDTTLKFDRTRKAALYARANIQEYWIVNLKAREVEVLREPKAGKYGSKIVVKESESIAPIAAPETSIEVKDLLP